MGWGRRMALRHSVYLPPLGCLLGRCPGEGAHPGTCPSCPSPQGRAGAGARHLMQLRLGLSGCRIVTEASNLDVSCDAAIHRDFNIIYGTPMVLHFYVVSTSVHH